jgi:hypothetical protein
MRIIPKYIVDFNIELDDDGNTLRYHDLIIFFSDYNDLSILEFVGINNNSLSLDSDGALNNINVFQYLTSVDILVGTELSHFYWITDLPKFETFITELSKTYNDLFDNYEIHKREFIIDSII